MGRVFVGGLGCNPRLRVQTSRFVHGYSHKLSPSALLVQSLAAAQPELAESSDSYHRRQREPGIVGKYWRSGNSERPEVKENVSQPGQAGSLGSRHRNEHFFQEYLYLLLPKQHRSKYSSWRPLNFDWILKIDEFQVRLRTGTSLPFVCDSA